MPKVEEGRAGGRRDATCCSLEIRPPVENSRKILRRKQTRSAGGGAFNFPSSSSSSSLSSAAVALEFQWRGFKVSGSVAEGFIKQEAAPASEDPPGSPLKLACGLKKKKERKKKSRQTESPPWPPLAGVGEEVKSRLRAFSPF